MEILVSNIGFPCPPPSSRKKFIKTFAFLYWCIFMDMYRKFSGLPYAGIYFLNKESMNFLLVGSF